jgi:hypothetical protein
MFKDEYSAALKQWANARKRTDAAEGKAGRTFLDWFFRRNKVASPPPVRPCKNVTPPNEPPKK